MQDPNSNQQNANTSRDDAFASPDGPQQFDKSSQTYNLDTGEVEPLSKPGEDEGMMDWASGSDGGSAGDGGAA